MLKRKPLSERDAAALLKLIWETWNGVFRRTLGRTGRAWFRNRTNGATDGRIRNGSAATTRVGRLPTAVRLPAGSGGDPWCRCKPISAAAKRTPCWRCTTCTPASVLRPRAARTRWHGRHARRGRCGIRGSGRCLVLGQPDFARQSRHRAGRHQGARTAGRVGLAARRRGGIRAGAGGRRERHQTGRRAAGTVQGLRTVAGADRRMGSLCAPIARRGRSASRRFRDTIHVRPGACRVRRAGGKLPAADFRSRGFEFPRLR